MAKCNQLTLLPFLKG